ncbi:hypothetical protein BJY04DRAFT_187754 [Aspergillus karnatakaensis]|uniref:uncharacterized protein n=1 Tax=Aspergillus karnatakaensis TaxID=1810916 RepID=UPI003CCDD629
MAVPAELTAEQESTLVRSALRSSLDGEDTELLNNFLSKAKAKREAKAAAAAETATAIAPDSEDVEEPQQQVFVEIPTPERRVLEALDANTSSPQKSPSKDERDEKTEANDSGSPVTRRSTRVKRAATTGTLRTTLSLRRATGTEFIFLQRTEAQKLALETKRNTKNNKGDASMPKYKLAGLAKQPPDTSKALDDNIRRPDKPIKYVSWNEDRLVEFEGESSDDELAPDAKPATAKTPEKKRAASSRAAPSPASLKTGAEKAAAAAPAAATTASPRRRVRRLGPPKPLDSTLSLDSTESSSPLSPTTGSPIAKRKKLTPKSPKSLSKIPTPSENGNGERPSLLSGGRSVKTNLLKVNAGSTPMPRRVRRA